MLILLFPSGAENSWLAGSSVFCSGRTDKIWGGAVSDQGKLSSVLYIPSVSSRDSIVIPLPQIHLPTLSSFS